MELKYTQTVLQNGHKVWIVVEEKNLKIGVNFSVLCIIRILDQKQIHVIILAEKAASLWAHRLLITLLHQAFEAGFRGKIHAIHVGAPGVVFCKDLKTNFVLLY